MDPSPPLQIHTCTHFKPPLPPLAYILSPFLPPPPPFRKQWQYILSKGNIKRYSLTPKVQCYFANFWLLNLQIIRCFFVLAQNREPARDLQQPWLERLVNRSKYLGLGFTTFKLLIQDLVTRTIFVMPE